MVNHPLSVGTRVKAKKPSCPCRGARWTSIEGNVLKVINNNSGTWYYLNVGVTIRADWVEAVL